VQGKALIGIRLKFRMKVLIKVALGLLCSPKIIVFYDLKEQVWEMILYTYNLNLS
jgi:hypothetical protein